MAGTTAETPVIRRVRELVEPIAFVAGARILCGL